MLRNAEMFLKPSLIRARAGRSPTWLAAAAATALLAGCGTAAGTGTASTTSTTGANQFNPQLVSTQTVANLPTTTPAKTSKTKGKRSTTAGKTGSHAKVTTASSVTSPTAGSVPKPVIKTVTITRTITILRPAPTGVPGGAHVPSSLTPMSLSSFSAQGGIVGCHLGGGAARCDIASKDWPSPARPRSCNLAWGQGIAVGPSGGSHFVCAGDSVLDPGGSAVPAGRDDTVGSVTCQVRTVGVTCFDAGGQGFFISRTGYYLF